ncbi:MAG TPA: thiamine diphosphokinase [Microthrixaceae bacterium]|nr:thiamine diphosphokinase [Microthrixaceae bacterium]HNJ23897.1 thiamine diphosphokinase [Microthrixaceae bacterium]
MGTCTHVVFAGGPIPGVDTRSRLSARLAALDVARVVAADSGLELADALGVDLVPGRDRVVGDMDSLAGPRLGAAIESGIDVDRFPVDKDATDLALALDDAAAAARSGDRLLVIATRSGRLDHMLATVPLLAAAPYDDYERDAWVDDDTLHVVRGLRRLTLQPGATMSVLPIHGDAVVTLRGVRWELSSQRLSAGTSLGVSNVVETPQVTVDVVEGTALVVVPRSEHDEEPEEVR